MDQNKKLDTEQFSKGFSSCSGSILRIQSHLLAVQEVHNWLQDIVSLLDYTAISWYCLTFDLGENIPHLSNVVLNLGLETALGHTGTHEEEALTKNSRRVEVSFREGNTPT